jgi:hypothetical protein
VEQFAKGYKILAELGYRPAAPSDGFGNITVPVAELDLEVEARAYAQAFEAMDQAMVWEAGCTDARLAAGAVLVLEAFRLMNGGMPWGRDDAPGELLIPRLLRRAAEEYERVVRADQNR